MLQQSTLQQTTLQQTTLQERAAQTRPRRQPAKRMVRVAALAASLLIAAGAGLLYLQPQLKEENWLASYSTRVGEKREVRLPDGSQLDLNTHSKILVEYTQNERRIILDYGEVFFSVAKDTLRPMNITVGDRTISVLGTKFNVHWSGPTVTLAVVEGLVSVRDIQGGPRLKHLPADDGQLPVWEDPDSATVYVEAGATVQFAEKTHTVISTQPQKTEQLQSWRSGTLRFDNEPLHKVISEINRYTANKIIIEDKTLMETPVSGVFKMDDIDTVLKGLGSALDLRVSRQLNGYVIASADQASEITLQ